MMCTASSRMGDYFIFDFIYGQVRCIRNRGMMFGRGKGNQPQPMDCHAHYSGV